MRYWSFLYVSLIISCCMFFHTHTCSCNYCACKCYSTSAHIILHQIFAPSKQLFDRCILFYAAREKYVFHLKNIIHQISTRKWRFTSKRDPFSQRQMMSVLSSDMLWYFALGVVHWETGGHWATSTLCSHPMAQLCCWAPHFLMVLGPVWLPASSVPFVNFSSSVCVKMLNTTLEAP